MDKEDEHDYWHRNVIVTRLSMVLGMSKLQPKCVVNMSLYVPKSSTLRADFQVNW